MTDVRPNSPRLIRTLLLLGAACLAVASPACSRDTKQKPEAAAAQRSAIIPLEPSTTVNDCRVSTREPKCPGSKLPDQCGSWAGVELRATRAAKGKVDVSDEHCLCEPIAFQIPAELSITQGGPGGVDWDKPDLSFRKGGTTIVDCRYRVGGAGRYILENCSDGSQPGQTKQSDWFNLALDGNPNATALQVQLRLGEPDVVGGVVQEQIFFSDDPLIPGAALHVPRGSAPAFETFSLDSVNAVALGTRIPNAGNPTTTISLPVDVHADSTDHFVFSGVPGASCPRIELPYDQATLERVAGPAGERSLKAQQLVTLNGITSGAQVLTSAGAVTVDLARRTFSFCVEHLSTYVGSAGAPDADLTTASIESIGNASLPAVDLLTKKPLPLLSPGQTYKLTLGFTNVAGPDWLDLGNIYLVAVGAPSYPPPPLLPVVTPISSSNAWNITVNGAAMTSTNDFSNRLSVTYNEEAQFELTLTCPSSSNYLNFCLREGTGSSGYFGDCFTWDVEGNGTTPVGTPETCNNVDDDINGAVDDDLTKPCYPPDPNNPTGAGLKGACHAGVDTCAAGSWQGCVGAVGPSTEACNNVDDNCDGAVDNLPTTSCYSDPQTGRGVGECRDGTQVCTGGSLVCLGEVRPSTSPDKCNDRDDDCDGLVDEDGDPEICDGVDNDCDHHTDEDCPLAFGYLGPQTRHDEVGAPALGDGSFPTDTDCPADDHGSTTFPSAVTIRGGGGGVNALGLFCELVELNTKKTVTPYAQTLTWWTAWSVQAPVDSGGNLGSFCSHDYAKKGLLTGIRGAHDGDHVLSLQAQCAEFKIDQLDGSDTAFGVNSVNQQVVHEVRRYWEPTVPNAVYNPPLELPGGGTPFEDSCPDGQYVARIHQRITTGSRMLNKISLSCAPAGVIRQQ